MLPEPISAISYPPAPTDVGLVFALSIESGGLADSLADVRVTQGDGFTVRQGEVHGRHVVLIESGAGRAAAARATHALLDAHRPRLVVSAGFGGGLDPGLTRGDLVVAQSIVDAVGRAWDAEPGTLPPWLAEVPRLRLGRLLTMDRIVRLPEEKLSLGGQHAAVAVDMESLAVAEVCRERGAAFLAVRVINDAAEDELPPDVQRLVVQKTRTARLGAALGAICRRPSSLKDMLQLQQRAIEDADRLAKFLLGVIDRSVTGT